MARAGQWAAWQGEREGENRPAGFVFGPKEREREKKKKEGPFYFVDSFENQTKALLKQINF